MRTMFIITPVKKEQQFMQLVSTFADVYFKDVLAPLAQFVILDPMRGTCILKKTR